MATSGRVTYRDTAYAPGVSAKQLLDAAYDTFARNLLYFDYPLTPADTLGMPRPHEPAAPGETIFTGSVLVFDPQSPPPVYVAGVSPPLDPKGVYPMLRYAVFTLRLRAEEGICIISITDLRLRSIPFDHQMKRMLAQYPQKSGAAPPLTHRLPGQAVEALYARWLSNAIPRKSAPAKSAHSAAPTEAEVRRLDETMRSTAYLLRKQMQAQAPKPH
ncbi:hypothetical protein [Hymenobacter rubidus]|uniref:hypothetical protein n=1 Tax=Hymenobacter rubidus TaxID=1441626 RepID=UPI00191F5ED1|nr:hypothetical protein [Hymenobacter rubidus]